MTGQAPPIAAAGGSGTLPRPATAAASEISEISAPGALWRRQLGAVVRLELRKSFLGRRALGLYLLALAPPAVFVLRAMLPRAVADPGNLADATQLMAQLYQGFILRVVVFLG